MADHSKPTNTSAYTDYTSQIMARVDDALLALDPARTSPTNLPQYAVRWSSDSKKWQLWDGTFWGDLATEYAINITGYAARWKTARTITLGQGASGSVLIDGSANVTLNVTALAWAQVSGAPATATRWPSWSEVTSKPTFGTAAAADVVTSGTDATAGRLLKVGYMGLGTTIPTSKTLATTDQIPTGGLSGFVVMTEDGDFTAPVTGNYLIELQGGGGKGGNGGRGYKNGTNGGGGGGGGGGSGELVATVVSLTKNTTYSLVLGRNGDDTTFAGVTARSGGNGGNGADNGGAAGTAGQSYLYPSSAGAIHNGYNGGSGGAGGAGNIRLIAGITGSERGANGAANTSGTTGSGGISPPGKDGFGSGGSGGGGGGGSSNSVYANGGAGGNGAYGYLIIQW